MEIINQVLLPAVNNSLTTAALLAAQVLAGMSQESNIIGALAGMFGRRDIWSDINDGFLSLFNQILLPAVNNSLTTAAILGAQVLAGMSQESNIISALGSMLGKRDIFSDLFNQVLLPAVNNSLTTAALLAAQVLAGMSQESNIISALGSMLGKRDIFSDLFNQVLLPAVNNSLTTAALLAAQVLAGMSQETNIISSLSGMLGKRQFSLSSILGVISDDNVALANQVVQNMLLSLAVSLATFGLGDGLSPIGRELKDFWTDLGDSLLTSVTDTANTLLSGLALQLAISLATFGLGGGISPIGK